MSELGTERREELAEACAVAGEHFYHILPVVARWLREARAEGEAAATEQIVAAVEAVLPGPCAFCRGTHPGDLDRCICNGWSARCALRALATEARPTTARA